MRFLILCGLLSALAAPALAAGHDHGHAAAPAPSPLLAGMGTHHFATSTRVPMAQRYFDQGFTLMYGFNHDEAIRSFRKALELDTTFAMARWAVAYSLGPNINIPDVDSTVEHNAWLESQRAVAMAAGASERERDYIAALAKRYAAARGEDLAAHRMAYKDAMAGVARKYPEDMDASTLYAESLMDLRPWRFWNADGTPAEGTNEILKALEAVLAHSPNHVGANHFYIHSVEASPHPERALPCAQRLKTLVPGAGHLVHMPAHVYQRVGRYVDAAKANEAGAKVDAAYIAKYKVEGVYPIMYYTHNIHFHAVSCIMAGQYAAAKQSATRVASLGRGYLEAMPMAEMVMPTPIITEVAFSRWSAILAMPEPPKVAATTRGIWHFARGLAQVARGNLAAAEKERNEVIAIKSTLPETALIGFNPGGSILRVAQANLEGEIAAARKDYAGARQSLEAAAGFEDSLAYDEPADWYLSSRERLGRALLRAHDYPGAEAAFRADLERNMASGRSLFGLMESLRAQKKTEEAARVGVEFRKAWAAADTPLRVADLYTLEIGRAAKRR